MPRAYIGIGGNLPLGEMIPYETSLKAIEELSSQEKILSCLVGRWYQTAPVPASDQPWYVNSVLEIITDFSVEELLATLQSLEIKFGRKRNIVNAARTLDLDILSFGDDAREDENLILPHPRLHLRAFVLYPLHDVAPNWYHPILRRSVTDLIASLGKEQEIDLYRPPK